MIYSILFRQNSKSMTVFVAGKAADVDYTIIIIAIAVIAAVVIIVIAVLFYRYKVKNRYLRKVSQI